MKRTNLFVKELEERDTTWQVMYEELLQHAYDLERELDDMQCPQWCCCQCGTLNSVTLEADEFNGDCDLRCNNCGSTEIAESPTEAARRLAEKLGTAVEAQRCECSADDACRFARERDEALAVLREAFPHLPDAGGFQGESSGVGAAVERRICELLRSRPATVATVKVSPVGTAVEEAILKAHSRVSGSCLCGHTESCPLCDGTMVPVQAILMELAKKVGIQLK